MENTNLEDVGYISINMTISSARDLLRILTKEIDINGGLKEFEEIEPNIVYIRDYLYTEIKKHK